VSPDVAKLQNAAPRDDDDDGNDDAEEPVGTEEPVSSAGTVDSVEEPTDFGPATNLNPPHGGTLVNLMMEKKRATEVCVCVCVCVCVKPPRL